MVKSGTETHRGRAAGRAEAAKRAAARDPSRTTLLRLRGTHTATGREYATVQASSPHWGDRWEHGTVSVANRGHLPMRIEFDSQPQRRYDDEPWEGPEALDVFADVLDGRWRIKVTLAPPADSPRIVEIALRPTSDQDAAIGTRLLRRLGFGGVLDEAERWFSDEGVARRLGKRWARPVARPGRSGRDDIAYARWAAEYVTALEKAPRSPVKQMIEDAAAKGVFRRDGEVRWYLSEARRRELLTAAPAGRPGGQLTPLAVEILRAAGEDV